MATKNENKDGVKAPKAVKATKESVAVQSVKALQAVTKALQGIDDSIATINALPTIVKDMQNDLTLGFEAFEVELEEKKATKVAEMEATILAKDGEIAQKEVKIASLDLFYQEKEAELRKQLARTKEEAEYDNKIAIRESKITTAKEIANRYDYVVIPGYDFEVLAVAKNSNEQAIADAVKKAETAAEIGYNAEVTNIKNANALEVKDLQGKLEAALDKVNRLSEEVAYLKNEIKEARETTAKTIQSLKSDVTVNNNGK
jgi:hypothetical protein